MTKRLLLICLLLSPAAAWALYKPLRVLAPQLFTGVSCVTAVICVDDISRYAEAERLYNDTVQFLASSVAPIEKNPRVVFCSTQACFESFGFSRAVAATIGVSGIVVSPRGWTPHYLRHEMIHHVQAERLGVLKQWRSPDWFKEGMAYSLSGDPRSELAEPWQRYRREFETWYRTVGKEKLWDEAKKL